MNPSSDLTIIKVGTGVLTRVEDGTLDGAAVVRLVTALATLMDAGHRCMLVSSGAVGSGVASFRATSSHARHVPQLDKRA
jgi:glutamate 5-kinase